MTGTAKQTDLRRVKTTAPFRHSPRALHEPQLLWQFKAGKRDYLEREAQNGSLGLTG